MSDHKYGFRVGALVALAGAVILSTMSGCALEQPGQQGEDAELVDSAGDAVRRTIQLQSELTMGAVVPPAVMTSPAPTGTGLFRYIKTTTGSGHVSTVAGLIFEINYLPNTSITITGVDVRAGLPGASSPDPMILGTITPEAPMTYVTDATGYLKEGGGGLGPPGDSLMHVAQTVVADPTSYYFEIRTTTHPNGWMRGQLHYPSGF
jgi:hypothetical protein